MDNSFNCQFCNSQFISQKSLDYHLKNARYCLATQGKLQDNFVCTACNKSFSTKHWLQNHRSGCINYIVNEKGEEIERLLKENSELKEMLKDTIKCIKKGDVIEIDQI